MKTLILADGTFYDFSDDSHVTHLTTEVPSFTMIDGMAAKITPENLSAFTFDNQVYTNYIPEKCYAEEVNDVITVTFITRQKTDVELMKEEITELQEALAEIAGGE